MWHLYDAHADGSFDIVNDGGGIICNISHIDTDRALAENDITGLEVCIPVRVSWMKLREFTRKDHIAHSWVTDASIQQALDDEMFDDPIVPHNNRTHHAARIATMIRMIMGGTVFPPPIIYNFNGFVHAHGNHRLRAYHWLGMDEIDIVVKNRSILDHIASCVIQPKRKKPSDWTSAGVDAEGYPTMADGQPYYPGRSY
jgi:hypothetical protein